MPEMINTILGDSDNVPCGLRCYLCFAMVATALVSVLAMATLVVSRVPPGLDAQIISDDVLGIVPPPPDAAPNASSSPRSTVRRA